MSKLTDYQIAALSYDKHISLTANAGSGKTTVLSKRFVEILVNEKISINNIVAITFTEKAASELYSKIAREFDEQLEKADKKLKSRLEFLRRSLVSAKISTIHSFCIDILKDYAPEAGIDASFSPVDARTSDELLEQSIDEVIRAKLVADSKLVKKLIRTFGNKSLLIKRIKQLFGKRKSTEKLISSIYQNDVQTISNWFEDKFIQEFTELFSESIEKLIYNIKIINKLADEYKNSEAKIEVERILNEIHAKEKLIDKSILVKEIGKTILTQKSTIKKTGYLSKVQFEENIVLIEETNSLFAELKDFTLTDSYEKLNHHLASFGKSITEFYSEIRDRYTNKKQQKSYLDFEDLLLISQELLNNQHVKESLSEKYKYVMIDEYQDTNETQYNIFMPILNNLASGNLFVVGDEKQSIYMFREAEVELFNKTRNVIASNETSASLLELPHSFRLTPNIAQFTNELFRKLFQNPNIKFNEVEYNELVCAYPHDEKGKVEFLISDEEEIDEAELIARKILLLHEEKYNFNDITILCSKRKNFLELEEVFSEKNIPFSIVGGTRYYQQQIILDIYNYLSFLINPKNDLALAAILRAPYFNLSDVEITKISLNKGCSLFEKLCNNNDYLEIISLLNNHIKDSKLLRPNELIRKINVETGYWSFLSSKSNSTQEIANLEKLIQKAISLNEQGFNTLFDFTSFLNEAINNQEDEGQADIDTGENSVNIMTIHQSKGLEFKVVILYKTNQKSFDETLKSKDIIVDKNYGILSKLPVDEKYFEEYEGAPIIGLYNYIQKKKSLAEDKRLLYVAITRAEEHLIISASRNNGKLSESSFAAMILDSVKCEGTENSIDLSTPLKFMKYNGEKYVTEDKINEQKIEIINFIEDDFNNLITTEIKSRDKQFVNISSISSNEKNEIVSASKISLFLNCPKKYELTYEFGYGELTKLFKSANDFEFNEKEYEEIIPRNIVGNAAHSVLEKNISENKLEFYVRDYISKQGEAVNYSDIQKENSVKEIVALIKSFYKSNSYKKLNKFSSFLNEAEFYLRERDYYLYGIIDKMIIDNDKIIVIDYKSDKINKLNAKEKTETYLNQLMFYSYILQKKYCNMQFFELWLVFLRDDSYSCIKKVTREEVQNFGQVIYNSVQKIRKRDFTDSYDGCKNMKYYLLD